MLETQQESHYFFRTLIGTNPEVFYDIMKRSGRGRIGPWQIENFLDAPDSLEGINLALGLDLREVMCTVSKRSPAVTYHRPFGLILEGNIKSFYDNDSGKRLLENGMYNNFIFDFTREVGLNYLLTQWYLTFENAQRFIWNEGILEKGSRVIGAFFDPNIDQKKMDYRYSPYAEPEFDSFIKKAKSSGLELLEISAKFP